MKIYNLISKKEELFYHKKVDLLLVCTLEKRCDSFDTLFEYDSSLLVTNAVDRLSPFSKMSFKNIYSSAPKSPREIFGEGMRFGREYELCGNALIIGEISKESTTTTLANLRLLEAHTSGSLFEILKACDVALLFCAGFLIEASRRFHLILSGGLEMAFVLFLADLLREELLIRAMSHNISFITSHQTQPMQTLLEKLSYTPHALLSKIELKDSKIEAIREINAVDKKENGASSAAVAYAEANAITNRAILDEMELILYMR